MTTEDLQKINGPYNIGSNSDRFSFYSDYTFDWFKQSKINKYDIPEAHPMANNADIIKKAILRHHDNGTVFVVSHYVDIASDSFEEDRNHAKFKIEIDNKEYNSNVYFDTIYNKYNLYQLIKSLDGFKIFCSK
ncbi:MULTISPECIES: hypothetical protein [unclassified Gilliamella]|uniref:hypothetical protein n=1 Tax=unclassified Gilliamella TaxID=2685620 RepID=UPI00080E2315|nr:hypothetical protein [Gilliamella apicola]OCG18726.1 hypothetical protein A9G23_09990 [Gilliamella apicola]OCG24128.1 hypothetical protein A9G22_05055 [Gilliamella apicola]